MRYSLLLISTLFFLSACSTDSNFEAEQLKHNSHLQDEVFATILNDEEMMADFMQQAMENPIHMHKLMMQESWIKEMFDKENMRSMPEQHKDMMFMMMNNMMQYAGEDTVFRNRMLNNENWQRMMRQHGDHMMDDHDNMIH